MTPSKEECLSFLEDKVFLPAESNPNADKEIKEAIQRTRIKYQECLNADEILKRVKRAQHTESGQNMALRLLSIGAPTFEQYMEEFKALWK